jgi:hypothetical protein
VLVVCGVGEVVRQELVGRRPLPAAVVVVVRLEVAQPHPAAVVHQAVVVVVVYEEGVR